MIGASTQLKTDLGYYKDLAEIQSRFPYGELGWSAKNLATQTVYIWDSVTLGWIDSGEGFPAEESTLQKLIGLEIPPYDEQVIDLADPNDISITYKKDSATVATKSIVTDGTTITITKT